MYKCHEVLKNTLEAVISGRERTQSLTRNNLQTFLTTLCIYLNLYINSFGALY